MKWLEPLTLNPWSLIGALLLEDLFIDYGYERVNILGKHFYSYE